MGYTGHVIGAVSGSPLQQLSLTFELFLLIYFYFCIFKLFLITSLWRSLSGQYGDQTCFFLLVLLLLFSLFSAVSVRLYAAL